MEVLKPKSEEEIEEKINYHIKNNNMNHVLLLCSVYDHTEGVIRSVENGANVSMIDCFVLRQAFYLENDRLISFLLPYHSSEEIIKASETVESRKSYGGF